MTRELVDAAIGEARYVVQSLLVATNCAALRKPCRACAIAIDRARAYLERTKPPTNPPVEARPS